MIPKLGWNGISEPVRFLAQAADKDEPHTLEFGTFEAAQHAHHFGFKLKGGEARCAVRYLRFFRRLGMGFVL